MKLWWLFFKKKKNNNANNEKSANWSLKSPDLAYYLLSPGLVRKASKDERNFRKRSTKFFEVNFFLGTSVLGWFKLDFSPKQVVRSTTTQLQSSDLFNRSGLSMYIYIPLVIHLKEKKYIKTNGLRSTRKYTTMYNTKI